MVVKALILLGLLFLVACTPEPEVPTACFDEVCFKIEIAQDIPTLVKGLMHRESLDEDAGMLFIFDKEAGYSFWMKNTLIPLDIIWLDRNRKVVYISKNTPPCEADPCPSYIPDANALYVLEINAGLSDKYGFDKGDFLKITIPTIEG